MGAEWVAALANVVIAGGVIVGIRQLVAANRQVALLGDQLNAANKQVELVAAQLKADHERSRCVEAVNNIREWTNRLDKTHPSARRLVNSFTVEQCNALRTKEPFSIPGSHVKLLEHIFQGTLEEQEFHKLKNPNGDITLNEKHLSHLWFLVISHLNALEVCLLTWVNGIADKKTIESQLRYLVNPEKNEYILANFRQAMGGANSYPAIEAFVAHLRSQIIPVAHTPRGNIA